jgi:hypothetical protein
MFTYSMPRPTKAKLKTYDNEVLDDLIKELSFERLPKEELIDLYIDLYKRVGDAKRKDAKKKPATLKQMRKYSEMRSPEYLSKKKLSELKKIYKDMNVGTFDGGPISKMTKAQLIQEISYYRIHF